MKKIILIALAVALKAATCYAQENSMFYLFDHDAKGYSTEMRPGYPNEAVMAGTIYDEHGAGQFHFIRTNKKGGTGIVDYPDILVSKKYDEPNHYHEHVVDIEVVADDDYFITGHVSPASTPHIATHATPNTTGTIYTSKIRVLRVNNNGDINAEFIIDDISVSAASGAWWGYSLFPIHTLYKENVLDNNLDPHDILYICGYMTLDPNPDFSSAKYSFILAVEEVTPGNYQVINNKYFDNPVTTTNNPELDYDIATRIQEIEMGPNTGDLFLTGSVTAKTGIYNGPPLYGYTCVRSATMVQVLDPWSLNVTGTQGYILEPGNQDGYGRNEVGFGLVQTNGGANNYILSNMYESYSSCSGVSYDEWTNPNGYNDIPGELAITHYQATSIWVPSANSRQVFDIGWGLDVLPSTSPLSVTNMSGTGTTFIIAGMANKDVPGCAHSEVISDNNFTPFLFDIEVDYTGGTVNYYSTTGGSPTAGMVFYPNNNFNPPGQTGDPTVYNNTYANLGGGLAYNFWHPTFAARSIGGDITLNAPRFADVPDYQRLGLKTLYANGTTLALGTCPIDMCDPTPRNQTIISNSFNSDVSTIIVKPSTSGTTTEGYIEVGACRFTDGGVYKPGKSVLEEVGENKGVSIHPNPADNLVTISSVDGAWGQGVSINVVDITGRTIFETEVPADDSNVEINTTTWASGTYIVNIHLQEGKTINKKLIINK